jgi:hypothetical protein
MTVMWININLLFIVKNNLMSCYKVRNQQKMLLIFLMLIDFLFVIQLTLNVIVSVCI